MPVAAPVWRGTALAAVPTFAQDFPSRPVRCIVPFTLGSAALCPKLPSDAAKDFSGVTLVASIANLLVVD